MKKKIIIVRITQGLESPIDYLNESFENSCERYYTVSGKDIKNLSDNDGLKCTIVFVIFNLSADKTSDQVQRLFFGDGEISYKGEEKGWRIYYKITGRFGSPLIIDNFISNLELDLQNDFDIGSYVNIESNEELIKQIRFIIDQPFQEKKCKVSEQKYQHIEKEDGLHEYSQRNENCRRPAGILPEQKGRGEFQRDYERIVHAKAYRRLVDKAQIFTSSKGDLYRTRLTHTLEVAQIARAIAVGLNLNVELTEAIALAHDLGHTPFGHQGERTLDAILKNQIPIIKYAPSEPNFFGGFKHNFQGLRVANHLEEKYIEFEGLDLSYQVLEGILKHTKCRRKHCADCPHQKNPCPQKCFDIKEFLPSDDTDYLYPEKENAENTATTLEGQVIAIADEIAQRSHDLDDSFSAGALSIEELTNLLSLDKMSKLQEALKKIKKQIENAIQQNNRAFVNLQELHHSRIVSTVLHFFISDVIEHSLKQMDDFEEDEFYKKEHRFDKKLIAFSYAGTVLCNYLEKIISKKVINSSEVVQFDNKASMIVKGLFSAYYNNPRLLHEGTLRKIYIEMRKETQEVIDFLNGDRDVVNDEIRKIVDTDLSMLSEKSKEYAQKKKILVRAIADFISGMTDNYAKSEYNAIYK